VRQNVAVPRHFVGSGTSIASSTLHADRSHCRYAPTGLAFAFLFSCDGVQQARHKQQVCCDIVPSILQRG
jgi:hypothetical protein